MNLNESFLWKSGTPSILSSRDHGYDSFDGWKTQVVQGRAPDRDLPDYRDSVLLCAGEFVT